jgi:hypothetical protein
LALLARELDRSLEELLFDWSLRRVIAHAELAALLKRRQREHLRRRSPNPTIPSE